MSFLKKKIKEKTSAERADDRLANGDFKMVSPAEALWTRFVEGREASIKSLNESLVIETALLELGKQKLEEGKTHADST